MISEVEKKMLYFVHKTEYHFKLSIFYYTYTLYPLYIKDINSQKKLKNEKILQSNFCQVREK